MRMHESTLIGYKALTEPSSAVKPSLKHDKLNHNSSEAKRIIGNYLRINKVLVGGYGSLQLEEMAEKLENEKAVSLEALHIQGWMFAEASLAGSDVFSWEERTAMIEKAQDAFSGAISLNGRCKNGNNLYTSRRYRIALAMAHLPLIQAIVDGDVTKQVQYSVTEDVFSIARTIDQDDRGLYGLSHELSMLGLIHMMKDPRYVGIPSTYRSDNGVHKKQQTHDISLIKQHFGKVRQIQPIEVKSLVSDDCRKQYWSTLLSSREIIPSEHGDPNIFNESMAAVFFDKANATPKQQMDVNIATSALVSTLKSYRTTGKPAGCNMKTTTRFYGLHQPAVA